jgi:predicted RNase H-like HicB family nuclease
MVQHCVIRTERLADGRFRATCSLLPDVEPVGDTEAVARQEMEKAIERHVRRQLGQTEPGDEKLSL